MSTPLSRRRPTPVRRTRAISLATCRDLPEPCVSCTVWELGQAAPDSAMAKRVWIDQVLREWGCPGHVGYAAGHPVGYVLYAPPAYVIGPWIVDVRQVADDSVLLMGLQSGTGDMALARMLVQAMARDLIARRDVRAIEAFGWRDSSRGRGGCLVSMDVLSELGFTVVQDHPRVPRMRLDLRRIVPSLSDAELAWERLRQAVGAVRPAQSPEPAPEQSAMLTGSPPQDD